MALTELLCHQPVHRHHLNLVPLLLHRIVHPTHQHQAHIERRVRHQCLPPLHYPLQATQELTQASEKQQQKLRRINQKVTRELIQI